MTASPAPGVLTAGWSGWEQPVWGWTRLLRFSARFRAFKVQGSVRILMALNEILTVGKTAKLLLQSTAKAMVTHTSF